MHHTVGDARDSLVKLPSIILGSGRGERVRPGLSHTPDLMPAERKRYTGR